ncbi:MAG: hypothetical protein HY781_02365 [Chloroflexi bacterium]|nr:hypothetical protein [Chloroflexota bacterium]
MLKRKVLVLASIFLVFLMSCDLFSNLPTGPTTDPQEEIAQAIANTQLAQTQMALSVQQTMTALAQNAPQSTYTFQPTYTQDFTPTDSSVTVSVSVNTNCRTGPGSAYDIIGALAVGQTAEVVGRSASSDNWIIKLPSNPAVTCWLWGQYATVVGNTVGLPVYTPPPTPTPTTPSTITITIYNNCGTIIFYAYISGSDDPSWGTDELGSSTISVGGSFTWIYDPGTYDVKVEDTFHNILYTWFGLAMTTDQYLVACP